MLGETLGPYRIDAELGVGGMGRVYAATVVGRAPGLDEGTRVALKVVHPRLMETAGFFKRFLREAELGKSVRHPNVVRTYDCDAVLHDGEQRHFLVMEYVAGQTLREMADELGRVPEELCRHVACEVANGLAAIHAAGVVHRDVKPENVIIALSGASGDDDVAERSEGNVPRADDHTVKVMDLGVARLKDEAIRLSESGAFVGSIHYAAPEQLKGGGKDIDGRADLHALGLVLYELSGGRHPYPGEDFAAVVQSVLNDEPRPLGELNPQVSPFFEELVRTLLAKDRDGRFTSAERLARVLDDGEGSTWWQRRVTDIRLETRRPLRRVRVPRETAVYGRDDALAELRALYGGAKAGDGRVLLLEGEAGIGKTRLVDEFVARLRSGGEDVNFLFGSYPPGGAATAAGAFSTAYREHFGSQQLEDVLVEYLTETPVLVPAFAALLRGEPAPEGGQRLTKDSLQTVFVHATRALAAERPTIVLVDDLHFAPEDGRALFAALALAVPGHRILLVGTARPGLPAEWTAGIDGLEHAFRHELRRLGAKDVANLLVDAFGSERLADELGFQIVRKSDGNPFFVFEILQGLREGQFITQNADGTWVRTRVIDQIEIPSSVKELIQARIADLSDDECNLLEVAACCGYEFDPLLVGSVLELGPIPVLQRFGRIEKSHRLVRSAGRGCVFDHHQVQEALYEGISDLLREQYHGSIAEALERRSGAAPTDPADLDGALAVRLCEHFLAGGRADGARRYLTAAMAHLDAGYLTAEAARLGRRALDVPGLVEGADRVRLLLDTSRMLHRLGRRDEERVPLEQALQLAEDLDEPGIRCRARNDMAIHMVVTSDYPEGEKLSHLVLREARDTGNTDEEMRALGNLAIAALRQGRFEEAAEFSGQLIAIAQTTDDATRLAAALGPLGLAYRSRGRYREARGYFEQHLSLAREIGDRMGETMATTNLGALLVTQGHVSEATERFAESLALARQIGLRYGEANAIGNLANAYAALGLYREAVRHHEHYIALGREIGNRLGASVGRHNLGSCQAVLGRRDLAKAELEASLATSREIGAVHLGATTLSQLAEIERAEGRPDDAERLLAESLASFDDRGIEDEHFARALLYRAALRHEQGRTDESRADAERVVAIAEANGLPTHRCLAMAYLSAWTGAPADDAVRALDDAGDRVEVAERMEIRYRLWTATSDPAHLGEAHRLLGFMRDNAPEEYRGAMSRNVALHRDIVEAWERHESSKETP